MYFNRQVKRFKEQENDSDSANISDVAGMAKTRARSRSSSITTVVNKTTSKVTDNDKDIIELSVTEHVSILFQTHTHIYCTIARKTIKEDEEESDIKRNCHSWRTQSISH